MEKERRIGDGTAAILVRDERFRREGGTQKFFDWLRAEGFSYYCHNHVEYGWAYVNLNSKIFSPGVGGARLAEEFGHHAVTLAEFMTIYNIYKKYEGFTALDFSKEATEGRRALSRILDEKEEADKRERDALMPPAERESFREEMKEFQDGTSFEKYREEIRMWLRLFAWKYSQDRAEALVRERENAIEEMYDAKVPVKDAALEVGFVGG